MFISKKNLANFNKYFKKLEFSKAIEIFNAIGIEVEELIRTSSPIGLVVGKIVDVKKIEGSNHLNYCTVKIANETLNIVCGAPNVEINKYVVVAPIGTKFSDDFVITQRKLLNHESNGMLCGYEEINPNFAKYLCESDKKGIIILDDDVNFNTDVYEYLSLNDEIYNLSIPSNRNDLNSWLALLNELNYQIDYSFVLNQKSIHPKILSNNKITIDTKLFKNHVIGEFNVPINYKTPWNIKKFLINAQINVTNTIADYANYITMLTACPIHFYDAQKVGDHLTFKLTTQEKKIKSLNNEEINLPSSTLVSYDANGNIACVVGVIGTHSSMVDVDTKKVMFEIINLDSNYVKQIAEKLKIKNNSTNLFSKPIPTIFLNYAYLFLENLLGKNNVFILSYLNNFESKKIKYHYTYIQDILGVNISKYEIKNILNKTGFKVSNNYINVPYYRIDIDNIYDIAEECLKSLDINKIKNTPTVSEFNLVNEEKNIDYILENKIRENLIKLGFYDVKTMNLVSKSFNDDFNFFKLIPYEISNPISAIRQYFRISLIPSLLEVLSNNLNKKNKLFNFFEIQKIYAQNDNINSLSIVLTKQIINNTLVDDINLEIELKLVLDYLANILNCKFDFKKIEVKELSSHANEIYFQNNLVGYFGKISKQILKKYDIGINDVYIINLNINALNIIDKPFLFKKINHLNPIYRQLTFINKKDVDINLYINHLMQFNNIDNVELIKIYEDKEFKSYTINIKIVSEKNLTNVEIEQIFNNCINQLSIYDLELKK